MTVVVAAGSQLAAEAGAHVGAEGGNAVDAAIAAIVTSMCIDPGVVAPGAGAYLTIWPDGGDPIVLDAYAEMPGRGLPPDAFGQGRLDISMAYGGGTDTIVGPGSVATPGAFAGFALASERWGRVPWGVLLEPAIEHARRGFPLTPPTAEYLQYAREPVFGWDPPSREALHDADGNPLVVGDRVHVAHLEDSLRALAEEGGAVLYGGELGRAISAAVLDGGGILTLRDLVEYQVLERRPTTAEIDGWNVATNPPPAIGGVTLIALLLLMLAETTGSPTTDFRLHAEIQRAVLDYRKARIDRADDRVAPLTHLLDLARAGHLAGVVTSASTSHTSATDTDGNACSITASAGYGSGMMPVGTGFWLNNSLGELELLGDRFHALAPGTRLVSNMAPTIARHSDGHVLAIGSPGADRITTALGQVLHRHLALGETLSDAVAAPRLHAEWFEGSRSIAYEEALTPDLPDGETGRPFAGISMFFGGVQAAMRNPDGTLTAAADPRRAGGIASG